MAYKLKTLGHTTGVSDNKRGLSIGLKLAFEDHPDVRKCVEPDGFLCCGEVWVMLAKDVPAEGDGPAGRLTSKRMAAATGALSLRPADVRFRLAIDDGTDPTELGLFKFSVVTVTLEPRNDPQK